MTTSDEVDPKDAAPTLVSAFSVMAATAMNFSEDAVVSIDFRFQNRIVRWRRDFSPTTVPVFMCSSDSCVRVTQMMKYE